MDYQSAIDNALEHYFKATNLVARNVETYLLPDDRRFGVEAEIKNFLGQWVPFNTELSF